MTTRRHRSVLRAVLRLRVGLLAGVLIIGGCGAPTEEPTPTADPSPTEEASASAAATAAPSADPSGGSETSVFELEPGDCFSVGRDDLTAVVVVDCEAPHEYETFALLDHPAGADEPYPGDAQMLEHADSACQPPFESFVGHDYQTSIWFITSLTPTDQTWADGDREIVCTLNQQDDHREPIAVTGSAEGAGE